MGVGGNFWDLLKPYGRHEGVDFLRDKRVAVDLSFWIVQHDAAIRANAPRARNPHLRTTFFRTITLFSKMGAFPVFVVDGEPSPLKTEARMKRFLLWTGLDPKCGKDGEETTPVKQRNRAFTRCVEECVELLELLGMPVLRAHGEAEALCAQLNKEGHVDACLTADSDSFLFGAKCVIKSFKSNSKEPFEVYNISDIDAGLGLKRKQMVAIALLVGNDHDLHGVPGFGVDTALRFVQLFSEDDILTRLNEVGKGMFSFFEGSAKSDINVLVPFSDEGSSNARSPHCSHCGHPGSKRSHSKISCEYCLLDGSKYCMGKPTGFKCLCPTCDKDRKIKKQKKLESWQFKVCERIATEKNFPNNEIIELYLCDNHGNYKENDGPSLRWDKPKVEALVDLLTYHQHWEPSYIRQRMLPMLSTIYLREIASTPTECLLLNDQYEFHSIERVKIRYGHAYYLVKWKRACCSTTLHDISEEENEHEEREPTEACESTDILDEPEVPQILVDGSWFLLTDENMELVQAAYPKEVDEFQNRMRLKELKSIERKANLSPGKDRLESGKSSGVQLSITEFYRTAKVVSQAKPGDDPQKNPPRKEVKTRKEIKRVTTDVDKNLPKSVRRRLLFD